MSRTRHRCCPRSTLSATPKPCSFISMRSLQELPQALTQSSILDQAGWHGAKDLEIPSNISLLQLPPRAPELNSKENIWQTVCSL